MNNREFNYKQEILNSILEDWKNGKHNKAFERLCWFCNGLLASVKELEDTVEEAKP